MLRRETAEPRLMNGLQEAVLLLCKAGLKFESTLSIDGLLAITVDHKEVFIVNMKEVITSSADHNSPDTSFNDRQMPENTLASNKKSANDLHSRKNNDTLSRVPSQYEESSVQSDASTNRYDGLGISLEDRTAETMDAPDAGLFLAKQSHQKPFSKRKTIQGSKTSSKSSLLALLHQQQQLPVDFSSAGLTASIRDAENDKRDAQQLPDDPSFDSQTHAVNTGIMDLQHNAIRNKDQLLCKIKTEPIDDESHFSHQVPDPLEAANCGDNHRTELTDYSQFLTHSYSVHRLLQKEMTAWSQDPNCSPTASSSFVRNTSCVTLPRRQFISSGKSNCVNCGTNTTTVWRRSQEGQLLCNACGCYYKLHKVHRPQSLMRDNIRRRSRRQQGMRWTMGILPRSSQDAIPFPLGWNQQDVEQHQ